MFEEKIFIQYQNVFLCKNNYKLHNATHGITLLIFASLWKIKIKKV